MTSSHLRRRGQIAVLSGLLLACVGCRQILGIKDHEVAGPSASPSADGGATDAGGDSGTPEAGGEAGATEAGSLGIDEADGGDAGAFGAVDAACAADSGAVDSGAWDAGPDVASSNPCGADSSSCLFGGIVSAAAFDPPDGSTVTLTDDGFELGETICDPATNSCLTGGITP